MNTIEAIQESIWSNLYFPEDELEFHLGLYEKYRNDLLDVKKNMKALYTRKDSMGLVPQLGDMEAELTYLRLREFKPDQVVEISPASGWSTSWILHALRDNGAGILHSYDLVDDSMRVITDELSVNRWIFHQGDVKENLHTLPDRIDYLFLDSDHSAEFANWYIDTLFPMINTGTHVSVHDILKRTYEPGWGEESLLLCSWLCERKSICMTTSRALKDKGYTKIQKRRIDLGLDLVIHPPDYNSMIFFRM